MKPDEPQSDLEKRFAAGLLHWNERANKRQMPWKGEKDPYKIWLSEIILQQTRVEQGWNYYKRFIETFPTVNDLAAAPEQQVFKLWEGLGYYTRCKNLIVTAKFIATGSGGQFPSDYASILALKGVGTYTAAAIASFAYNLPYAVLDGNVFRVLSRIFDVELPIDSTEGKRHFSALAQQLLPQKKAGVYNQAIMDFGAMVCKPQPECAACFFANHCQAFLQKKQLLLPVKSKKGPVKDRWFNYALLRRGDEYALWQRTGRDIWQNLYEFLLFESDRKMVQDTLLAGLKNSFGITDRDYTSVIPLKDKSQRLSHQLIHFSFLMVNLKEDFAMQALHWVVKKNLKQYPFPKTVQLVAQQVALL